MNDRIEKGIQIILSVYSGRSNPFWMLTEGPDYERLISLIKTLNVSKDSPFLYNEWNQLGYASFWIIPRNIEGMPRAIHVWRDMTYIVMNRENEVGYALDATEIYNLLVSQAEQIDLGGFFVNYRKFREKLRRDRTSTED